MGQNTQQQLKNMVSFDHGIYRRAALFNYVRIFFHAFPVRQSSKIFGRVGPPDMFLLFYYYFFLSLRHCRLKSSC